MWGGGGEDGHAVGGLQRGVAEEPQASRRVIVVVVVDVDVDVVTGGGGIRGCQGADGVEDWWRIGAR